LAFTAQCLDPKWVSRAVASVAGAGTTGQCSTAASASASAFRCGT
jgi:hypothetical protein